MIKNIALLIFTFTVTAISSYAQQEETPLYTRAGFKAGANYTNISGDIENTDGRLRIHIGAVIEFPVSSRFYIQPEVLFSAQGYVVTENNVKNEIGLTYLTLPLIMKYYITEKLSLETGPQLATLTTSSNSIGDDSDEFFNSFRDFDFSWSLGAGYKLESGLFFQLRYNIGINSVTNSLANSTNRNAVAQLSIGYLFKTKNNRRHDDKY